MKPCPEPTVAASAQSLAWVFDRGRAGSLGGPAQQRANPCRLRVAWARHEDEVREAQRLRYQVFVGEMGASLQVPVGTPAGYDADAFDPHCEHLLVRAAPCDEDARGRVVGTYRVLRPEAARRIGGLYADREFVMDRLAPLRPRALELGRSCVHRDWRHGGVIMALWGALGQFMLTQRLEAAIGCASISLKDGDRLARGLWQQLRRDHLAAPAWWVVPRSGLPAQSGPALAEQPVPALIKGYLRCGAKLLGPPALDTLFGTADFPMLLQLSDMPPRYSRRLLK